MSNGIEISATEHTDLPAFSLRFVTKGDGADAKIYNRLNYIIINNGLCRIQIYQNKIATYCGASFPHKLFVCVCVSVRVCATERMSHVTPEFVVNFLSIKLCSFLRIHRHVHAQARAHQQPAIVNFLSRRHAAMFVAHICSRNLRFKLIKFLIENRRRIKK